MSRRFTRFLLGGFLLIIIFLAVLLVLPLFLNPTYLKDMAFAHIQRTFGPHIRVGETSLSLLPYPHVEVSEVTVKERPDTHAFFRAKFISLDLKLLPLLQQKFSVKELLIEQPEIEIKRDRQGEWLILQGNPQEAEDSFLASLLFMEKVVVIDGRITFIDESPKDEARGVVLEDVNLSIESASSPVQSANIEASGKIRRGQGVSELSWNGWVDFGSSSVTPTDGKGADNFQDFQIDGQLFIQDLEIRQVSEFFAYDSEMTADLGLVRLESHVTLKPGQVGYEVILSDLTVDNDHGSFSGNANITGLLADDLTVFVSMRSTPISLEIVQHAIPKSLFPSSLVARSDEAKLDGTIQVIQASVTSSSRTDVGISVLGSFQLDQSSVKIHDKAPELEIEHGVMVVEPDRVRFTDFSGTYDAIPIQSANGLILFNDSGPWLDLEVLAKVQPRQVLKVFTTFSGAKIPNTYFSRLHLLEGAGNLRLHLAGLLEGGAGVSLTAGEYDVQGVTYQIPDFERQMLIHKGTVEFTQDELKFNEINVGLGDSQLRVNGAIKVGKRALIEALSIQAVLKDALLKQIVFKSFHFPSDFLRGVVNLQARVSGFWDSPTITGDLNLLDSALHVSGVIQKQPGVAASLNYSIRVKTNGDVALDQVELAILPLKVSGRGLIRFQPTFEILARVNTGPIYLGLLPNGVVVGGQVLASGILEVSMDIRGRGLDVQQWRPRGWIALTEGVMNVRGLNTPINNLFLRLKITPSIAAIKRLEFKLEQSDVNLTGAVKNWRETPDIDVSLESSKFDLDLLIPQGERSSLRNMLEDLAGKGTLIGNIHIQHSAYKNLRAENLHGILKIREGLVTLDRIRGKAYGESIVGRVFIHLPPHKSAAIRSSFHVRGVPFEDVHQSLGYTNRLVTGQFSVRGMIQGHGRDPRGVVSTLNGNMDVMIEDGHILKGTILPRILKILNLPSVLGKKVDLQQQGFPFEKVTATLKIEDGIMTSNNVIVDSPIMKMTTAGHYDLANDVLDVVAAVSPFGRYSDFLKTIPLFGRILAGERKGIATALFQVQGSLMNPDVRYMPLKSFATGLTGLSQLAYDILKNSIALPVDLLKPKSSESEKNSLPTTPAGPAS